MSEQHFRYVKDWLYRRNLVLNIKNGDIGKNNPQFYEKVRVIEIIAAFFHIVRIVLFGIR